MIATDRFYYIMDYNGNYYRADSKDQLVVGKDETEAGVFSFTDANMRIGAGVKSHFYFMTPVPEEAEEEETMPDTNEIVDDEEENVTGNIAEAIISTVNEVMNDDASKSTAHELAVSEIPEYIEKSISEYDLAAIDWKEYLLHFTYVIAGLKDYRESLVKAESDIDLKICDILHYVELCEINDEEAASLIELLRVCREKRRDIKDEIIKLDAFQKNLGTSANEAKAKTAIKAISGLDTRKYTPRRYSELFDGEIIQIPPSEKKRIERRKEIIEKKEMPEYHKEETKMEYVRKETIFDGRDNDWVAFARQQAEFYKNAEQYIINLKLDMEEIDNAICDLMQEIEVSNCNVAQGYKLFKRLKELRLERKQKEQEIECLYILTEHFDVEALAEECECNRIDMEKYFGIEDSVETPVEMQPVTVIGEIASEDTRMAV